MAQLYHTLLDVMGVCVGLSLLGWGLYRLAVFFGIISEKKKRPQAGTERNTYLDRQGQQKASAKARKNKANQPSRQALYSARKDRS